MGYFEHIKLNIESMISKSVKDFWYEVDLIIDWEEGQVSIFLQQDPGSAQPFFVMRATEVKSANALGLYGLSPEGVSKFRNV